MARCVEYVPPWCVHRHSALSLSTDELRHAARILFDAGVVRLSDEESAALVDAWQHHRQ